MRPRPTSVIVLPLAVALVLGGLADNAYATTGKQMQGSGSGFVKCPSAFSPLAATISTNLSVGRGTASGSVQIFGMAVFLFGTATNGQIRDNKYVL